MPTAQGLEGLPEELKAMGPVMSPLFHYWTGQLISLQHWGIFVKEDWSMIFFWLGRNCDLVFPSQLWSVDCRWMRKTIWMVLWGDIITMRSWFDCSTQTSTQGEFRIKFLQKGGDSLEAYPAEPIQVNGYSWPGGIFDDLPEIEDHAASNFLEDALPDLDARLTGCASGKAWPPVLWL